MKPVLLDTGCIIALLDRSEQHHARCVNVVANLAAPLITCEAVIAESCYLLRKLPGAADAVLENVERGNFQVAMHLADHASAIRRLRKKYAGMVMDLADACLVHMAQIFQTGAILTLDSDFRVYRWARNKPFECLLDA